MQLNSKSHLFVFQLIVLLLGLAWSLPSNFSWSHHEQVDVGTKMYHPTVEWCSEMDGLVTGKDGSLKGTEGRRRWKSECLVGTTKSDVENGLSFSPPF